MTPTRLTMSSALVGTLLQAGAGTPLPQNPALQSAGPIVPLKVQIVVSRYEGEKKVGSMPFTVIVNANDGVILPDGRFSPFSVARLRSGATVPVPTTMPAPKDTANKEPTVSIQYRDIGTNIDCSARSVTDGRYRLDLSIEDSSVYGEGQKTAGVPASAEVPSFRAFKASNAVILKDGESTQFTVATDRISGELIKVDVTINAIKR